MIAIAVARGAVCYRSTATRRSITRSSRALKRDPFGKGCNAREAVPVIHLQDKRGESDYVVVNGAGGANAECFGSR